MSVGRAAVDEPAGTAAADKATSGILGSRRTLHEGTGAAAPGSCGARATARHAPVGLRWAAPWRRTAPAAAVGRKAAERTASGRRSVSARQGSFSAVGDAPGWPPSGVGPVAAATAMYARSPLAGSAAASAPLARAQTITGDRRRPPTPDGRLGAPEGGREKPRPWTPPLRWMDLSRRERGAALWQEAGTTQPAAAREHETARSGRRADESATSRCAASGSAASARGCTLRRWFAGATPLNSERTD